MGDEHSSQDKWKNIMENFGSSEDRLEKLKDDYQLSSRELVLINGLRENQKDWSPELNEFVRSGGDLYKTYAGLDTLRIAVDWVVRNRSEGNRYPFRRTIPALDALHRKHRGK